MDKLTRYQEIIKKHLLKIEELCNRRPRPGVETLAAFDDERGIYLLLVTGWTRDHRVRGATLFVRLKNGKIWVEEDWTEGGIVAELMKAGVPKDDIVLAFHPPEKRPYTDFAVA
jgi:hypothetical protein